MKSQIDFCGTTVNESIASANLERFALNVGWLWDADKAEEQVLAEVLRGGHLQEGVHENFESNIVNFLKA